MASSNRYTALIIIPCLNEEAHIGSLLAQLAVKTDPEKFRIIVADGGSQDRTRKIVEKFSAEHPNIVLFDNPYKIQSWAVNLCVSEFGDEADYLIRIDAHCEYPDDYCAQLIQEAKATNADSVAVSMETVGRRPFQKSNAAAQNSKLGNGGAKHRSMVSGQWVDHGHHALMTVSAFCNVGGYDVAFKANEDAELDYRLSAAGYRIWLTSKTRCTYFPRQSVTSLFRQYQNYGFGRAQNLIKHRVVPKARQMLPVTILPIILLSTLAIFHWAAMIPLIGWVGVCLSYGFYLAYQKRDWSISLAGLSAMTMHLAWSIGFWRQLAVAATKPGD